MKKFFIYGFALLLSVCAAAGFMFADTAHLDCQARSDVASICVLGEACHEVAPDQATITASIETLSNDITKAKDENSEIYNNVVNALVENGIAKESIVTESFSAYPNYDYSGCKTLIGYQACTSFCFKVNDLSMLRQCLDTLTESGVTRICCINYAISNQEELYNQTLSEAFENAKGKASNLTGIAIDELQVFSINEEYVYTSSSLYRNYDSAVETDMVGKVTICAKLKVEFALNEKIA